MKKKIRQSSCYTDFPSNKLIIHFISCYIIENINIIFIIVITGFLHCREKIV